MKPTNLKLDDKILELTKRDIERAFGTLDDLPYELANIIANYYYKSWEILSGNAESQALRAKNVYQGLISYVHEAGAIINFRETIPETVNTLRKIDRRKQPRLYYYMVNYALDVLKYNIPDAHKKSHIRRQFERIFRKKRISEIPNLSNFIQENK